MNNNDVFRRIRYIFGYNDVQSIGIFALEECKVTRNQVCSWLKKEKDEGYVEMPDVELARFLNGIITVKRGKKGDKPNVAESMLTNNVILRKLRIALNLRDEDMIEIFMLADMKISKPELSAFFRSPDKSQYRLCKDQFLRNFLFGMQKKYQTLAR